MTAPKILSVAIWTTFFLLAVAIAQKGFHAEMWFGGTLAFLIAIGCVVALLRSFARSQVNEKG